MLTAEKRATAMLCSSILESATVTKQFWKRNWWNAVNPSSEQPKLMVGALLLGNERKKRHMMCRQMMTEI